MHSVHQKAKNDRTSIVIHPIKIRSYSIGHRSSSALPIEVILHRHFKYIGLKTYKSCIKTAFVYIKFLRY